VADYILVGPCWCVDVALFGCTVITQKLLLHVQRLTAKHIYCTNTVQFVKSATELYLQ